MDRFWHSCLRHFEKALPPQQFNTWIKPLRCVVGEAGHTLVAPNRFVQQWVRDKFLDAIAKLALTHYGTAVAFEVVVAEAPAAASRPAPAAAQQPAAQQPAAQSRLSPIFTFDNFVTGKANELARAAALQVTERPGAAYNPLFIYGGTGLGKTHLVQAIGNLVQSRQPEARIRYIHAEQYVSDVVRAYQHKAFDDFKRYYHSLDLLLIDDIQFFAEKKRTQEEFFYAFNSLIEAHRQVVITCDTFPKDISGMEGRLISRFGWGLTVAIEPPELEMRVAILIRKAAAENTRLPEDVAFFVAKHIQSNVRELEGALKRILALSRFRNLPLSLELAKEALRDMLASQSRQITIENIQKTVAEYYKIRVAEMYSKKRTRNVARPRQLAMALAKELTHLSLPAIGDAFGGRDHTTVLHAHRKILELKKADQEIGRDFNALVQILRG